MKKTTKKLSLNVATVRVLHQDLTPQQLVQIGGGTPEPRTDGCGSRSGVC